MVGVLPAHVITNLCNENMGDAVECGKCEVISVGSRVRCDVSVGTVKYIGEVSGYSGLWYGIDWDDINRGKHDGSVNGVQYFEARDKTSGSFVRPNKISPSITCADAIRKYYGENEDENTAALYKAGIDDLKRQIKVAFIEMVGFDSIRKKQSTLDQLLEACVSDMNVFAGGDLSTLCPSLRILDISKNLVADWRVVADIAAQLPQLEKLDVSKNMVAIPTSDEYAEQLSFCFQKLRRLVITYCDLEWQYVRRISLMLPQLEMLVVAYNRITHMEVPLNASLLNLTQIVLDGNPLVGWSEVLKIGCMKDLKFLSLNDCQLNEIRFDEKFEGEKTNNFLNLEVLHLKFNLINDWRSISELDKLLNLQKLYFLKNPILEGEDYDTCSQLIVARIGNLKELNGSEVENKARRGAEYDYLKRYGKEWKKLSAGDEDVKEFLLNNSRFRQLIDKYGVPEDSLLEKKEMSHVISNKLIEIILKDDKSDLSFKKKLPSTMSIQKLSALARRLFAAKHRGNQLSDMSLYCLYTSKSDAKEMTVHLDNQLKELGYFSVADGDTVLIKW